jgi:hypothetical protein
MRYESMVGAGLLPGPSDSATPAAAVTADRGGGTGDSERYLDSEIVAIYW